MDSSIVEIERLFGVSPITEAFLMAAQARMNHLFQANDVAGHYASIPGYFPDWSNPFASYASYPEPLPPEQEIHDPS